MRPFRYRLHGLLFSSELEIPELTEAVVEDGLPDVTIVVDTPLEEGEIPRRRGLDCHGDDEIVLRRPAAGIFHLRGGREIRLRAHPAAHGIFLRSLIYGICAALILRQRGQVLLHGTTVVLEEKTITFCGDSQAGKSTLALEFIRRGWSLWGDDGCALMPVDEEGVVRVEAGVPVLKIWADTAARQGVSLEGAEAIRPGAEKYLIHPSAVRTGPARPLTAAFLLGSSYDPRLLLRPLRGQEGIGALSFLVAGHSLPPSLGGGEATGRCFVEAAAAMNTVAVTRPRWGWRSSAVADAICDHLRCDGSESLEEKQAG